MDASTRHESTQHPLTDTQELAAQLVRIDSSDPGAYEGAIEAFIKEWLERAIFRLPEHLRCLVRLEELDVIDGRRQLMAMICGAGPEAALAYICHMDTVTLGEGWTEAGPLSAEVREGRLYGRGSCDMKGGLACALTAFSKMLDELLERGRAPRRSLKLICTVDEEDFMRGVEAAIAAGWVGTDEWVLDTEPTDSQIQVAHKGRTWFEVRMQGVTAHASQPWKGADAVAGLAEAICAIRRRIESQPAHDELGRSTVTFGQVEGGYRPYVVPDEARVWIDMRLAPPCTTEVAKDIVKEALAHAEHEVPGTQGSYIVTGDRPAIERDPASGLLRELRRATTEACGHEADVGIFTGYTDTAVIAGTCANHNCMSYGPGSLALAHKPNEHVPLADIDRVEAVLARLARNVIW